MMIHCLQAFTVSTTNKIGDICLIIHACVCLSLYVYICPQNCSKVVNKLHCNFMKGSALSKDNTVKVCGQMHHLQWTSSLETLSSQLIFPILLHIHISKASNFLLSVCANVHISAADSLHLGNLTFVVITLVEACTVWVFSSWCYCTACTRSIQCNLCTIYSYFSRLLSNPPTAKSKSSPSPLASSPSSRPAGPSPSPSPRS